MSRPIALITGASAGIGRELARVYAANGYDLVVTARREAQLAELAGELQDHCQVHVLIADLSRSKGPQKLFRAVEELGVQVDVLVNNAGVLLSGALQDMKREQVLNLVNLNVRAVTDLIALFLPQMLARGSGRILNVASTASFNAVPGLSVYSASKAFVLSLTEGLSEELNGTGVTATALCPGPTNTEMVDAVPGVAVAEVFLSDAREVAREGFRACEAGEVIRVPGGMNQAVVTWTQYQPRWLKRFFSGIAARNSFNMGARGGGTDGAKR